MRKSVAIVIALVVAASCIAWLRRQHFFSWMVAAITVVLLLLILYGGVRWLVQAISKSESTSAPRSARRLKSLLLFVPLFLLLMLMVPHYLATSSGAYKVAVATATKSPQFTEALGGPVKEGWFSEGKLEWGDHAKSEITIPVYGRARNGNLRAVATHEGGTWRLEKLSLELTDPEEHLDLLSSQDGSLAQP